MKKIQLFSIAIALILGIAFACKKKDSSPEPEPTPSPTTEKKYALVIDNGAQSLDVGKSITFSAHLVSSTGATLAAPGITWSSNVSGMNGSVFSLPTATTGIVSASVVYEGNTYTAAVPISVLPLGNTRVFDVIPSAIIWSTNAGDIQLTPVYFGTGTEVYSYTSNDPSIVSVSSTGMVSFKKVGTTSIKVNGTINGQSSEFIVPVMVVGMPDVPLPVVRITASPAVKELFKGEKFQISAKAFNSAGDDVTSTVTFNYLVIPKMEEDEDPATTPTAVAVSASGEVTALTPGSAYVKVSGAGFQAQVEIEVNPDYMIMVNPFYTTLGTDFSDPFNPVTKSSQTFTATTYKVNRAVYHSGVGTPFSVIPNPANLKWELPLTGIAQIDDVFKVVTLSNSSINNVTATQIQGKVGSTFVIVHNDTLGGGASILVNP